MILIHSINESKTMTEDWSKIRKTILEDSKTREVNRVTSEELEKQRRLAKIRDRVSESVEEELKDPSRYSYDTTANRSYAVFKCSGDLSNYESSWNSWKSPPCEIYKQMAIERGFHIHRGYSGTYNDNLIVGVGDDPNKE